MHRKKSKTKTIQQPAKGVKITHLHIRFQVPRMILPNRPRNARPRLLDHQNPLMRHHLPFPGTTTLNNFPRRRVNKCRFHSPKRNRRASRFSLNRSRQRRHHDTPRFSLPPCIDNSTFTPSDMFIVPEPCFAVDRFANRTEDSEGSKVVWCDMFAT